MHLTRSSPRRSWRNYRRIRTTDSRVGRYISIIRAIPAWLGRHVRFSGRIGDKLGRSRVLSLTILTNALFTRSRDFFRHGQGPWHLYDLSGFSPALRMGGEWGGGRIMLAETCAAQWRP